MGTCGQRCTSTRRLIIHNSIYDKVRDQLTQAYKQIRIGNPLDENNHVGPLIDTDAVAQYERALDAVVARGQCSRSSGRLEGEGYESGLCEARHCRGHQRPEIVQHETFAPILYLMNTQLDEPLRCKTAWCKGCLLPS